MTPRWRSGRAGLAFAVLGALLGTAAVLLVFAPAAWLARAVAGATEQRLLLADARGSLWQGSATPVLTGGVGSRDASALPGRLHWTLGLDGTAWRLRLRQDCCLNGELQLRLRPGLGGLQVELPAPSPERALGQWPAAWLAGLGTPWNTLQPSGTLVLSSPGFSLRPAQGGGMRFSGRVRLDLEQLASRVSTLAELGTYRLDLTADNLPSATAGEASSAAGPVPTRVQLATRSGPLQLSGSGEWAAGRLRFRGQASAAPGFEAVLGNLLNIIGRRQGAVSLISIG